MTHQAPAAHGDILFEIFPWNANFETGIGVVAVVVKEDVAKSGCLLRVVPLDFR